MEGIPPEKPVTGQKSKQKSQRYKTLKLIVILSASMLTIMGSAAVAPALPEMLEFFSDVPDASLLVSMVVTLPALGIIISSPFIGILADKYSRKNMLMIALGIFAFIGATGAVLNSLYIILAFRVLLGVGIAGMTICATALLADNYSGAELKKKIGLQSACMGFGAVVLEVAGGALADISWHAPFYIYLIALLIIPGAMISLSGSKKSNGNEQNNEEKHHAVNNNVEKHFKEKKLPLKSIALIYVATFTLMVLFFSVPTKLPFVLDEKGITSALIIGALISIPGLFGTVGALAQVKVSGFVTEMKTNLFFFIMMGAGVFILSVAPDMPTLIAGLIIAGIAFGIINTTNLSWLGRIAPEESRGKIFSGFTTVLFLGQLASPLVIQPILKTGTLYDAYAFLGIAGICLGLVFGVVNGMGIIEQTPVVSGHPVGIEAEE
ncbi:arabinose efflux permease family protein [Methanolobus tindarius DSM 2278]|uniref:Arabinose efflux permease family protein n=1 Tax=Methanolobus tindarius DSM 2278 TaxID=1090322 RepID=W9E0I0_METTI|nr:MFS transporter [Methanolobus tindarius]ETA69116.1 arabinose efflux permease family protein [Methanolobus tindarius DSM 2278]